MSVAGGVTGFGWSATVCTGAVFLQGDLAVADGKASDSWQPARRPFGGGGLGRHFPVAVNAKKPTPGQSLYPGMEVFSFENFNPLIWQNLASRGNLGWPVSNGGFAGRLFNHQQVHIFDLQLANHPGTNHILVELAVFPTPDNLRKLWIFGV